MKKILALILSFQSVDDVEQLIRDLGDDRIEIRERAHGELLTYGEEIVPRLLEAAKSPDAEVRTRALAIAHVVGRADRERAHDADQKRALLLLRRDANAERRPGSGATEGARFDLAALPFADGWVISTSATDYLQRPTMDVEGRGLLTFDVRSIADASGKELEIQRCGRCSPGKVYVKAPPGPLAVRIRGDQVWFSPYNLEFQDPLDGQFRSVGDFRIEVAWPNLRVTSPRSVPTSWLPSMGGSYSAELKEGSAEQGVHTTSCGYACGSRVNRRAEKRFWCECPNGPTPFRPPPSPASTSEFSVSRAIEPMIFFPEEADKGIGLRDVKRITYTFWKPLELPTDVTIPLVAK